MVVGRNADKKFSLVSNVGHSEKSRPPKVGHQKYRVGALVSPDTRNVPIDWRSGRDVREG
jgi:hypothetical protein